MACLTVNELNAAQRRTFTCAENSRGLIELTIFWRYC